MTASIEQGVRYDARHAAAYDRKIRQLIPAYEWLHTLSAALLGQLLPASAKVLVAGSGTGEELLRYAALAPAWSLQGVEPSGDMNALAAEKCQAAGIAERVRLIEGKPGEVVLGQGYDAVTSLLVMHFLPDDGAKQQFLSALATTLRPGGYLLLADLGGEPGEATFENLFRAWRAQQDASRDRPEQVELDFHHLRVNVHPVSDQRRGALLAAAGLQLRQEYWRAFGLAAVLVQKAD
ncbi:class I SAM-dependent methyltransferase [Chitinimonas naiadis]